MKMTQYAIPKAEAFNLLGEEESANGKTENKKELSQPTSHIKSRMTFSIMMDDIELPLNNLPIELSNDLR